MLTLLSPLPASIVYIDEPGWASARGKEYNRAPGARARAPGADTSSGGAGARPEGRARRAARSAGGPPRRSGERGGPAAGGLGRPRGQKRWNKRGAHGLHMVVWVAAGRVRSGGAGRRGVGGGACAWVLGAASRRAARSTWRRRRADTPARGRGRDRQRRGAVGAEGRGGGNYQVGTGVSRGRVWERCVALRCVFARRALEAGAGGKERKREVMR